MIEHVVKPDGFHFKTISEQEAVKTELGIAGLQRLLTFTY